MGAGGIVPAEHVVAKLHGFLAHILGELVLEVLEVASSEALAVYLLAWDANGVDLGVTLVDVELVVFKLAFDKGGDNTGVYVILEFVLDFSLKILDYPSDEGAKLVLDKLWVYFFLLFIFALYITLAALKVYLDVLFGGFFVKNRLGCIGSFLFHLLNNF